MVMNNKFNLDGKIALVTGGAGLLGIKHCEALLELGATVYMADLNINKIDNLSSNFGSKLFPIIMDVTDEKAIVNTARKIEKKHNKFDILVNNAAIDPKVKKDQTFKNTRFENFSRKNWELEISVGLTGAMLCSKHFSKIMKKNNSGVILNIASDLSVISPYQDLYKLEGVEADQQPVKPVTYSVIKSGLIGLTRYLSTYYASSNIRVNALSPGGVFNHQNNKFVSRVKKLIPLNRMASSDEYKSAVQFLCSDASSYMTGQNIIIDGGRSVW